MKFLRQHHFAPHSRSATARLLSGFGAVIGRETALLWLLKSGPASARVTVQTEIVEGIIAALQQRFEQLPSPRRFDFLKNGIHRAETRAARSSREHRPSVRDLIVRNRSLEQDLLALKALWPGDRDWAPTLSHAAASHAQMAYALRLNERRGNPPSHP